MKVNTKTRYGLQAIIELAMNWGGKGVFQKDIAERQKISYKYLDHIIASLKAKGLIANVEGKKSGYKLTRHPERISAYDVFTAFESKVSIIEGLSLSSKYDEAHASAAYDLWNDLNQNIIKHLKSVNMKELADKQKKANESNAANMFYI